MKKVHILCFPLFLLLGSCNQRSSKGHLAEEGHTLARICSQRSSKGHLAGKGHTYLHRTEPKDLLAKLPTHLQKEPRLIIGRTMPAYLRTPNDYEKVTIASTTVFIPKSRGTCYVEGDGFTDSIEQGIQAYCKNKGVAYTGWVRINALESGQVALRTHDVTVDLEDGGDKSSDAPHVQKDAWDPATVQQIKKHGQKFGAIVFERVSTLPLYWDAYLQKLASHKDQHCYKFPDPVRYRYPMGGNRDLLKAHYDQGYHFYVPVIKTTLPEALPNASTAAPPTAYPDPTLVTTVLPSVLNPGKIPTLKDRLDAQAPSNTETTNILKAYYDLLAPGGLFVFMSASSGVNRHGGCMFEYKGERYSPFQDLDDPNMQAVYQSLLARAGFTEIKFKKDLYYTEDVLFIVAKKP